MSPLSLPAFTSRKIPLFLKRLRHYKIGLISTICALMISSALSSSDALTLKRYALSELGERADIVARASVIDAKSAWVERRIITTYTLAIIDLYQGKTKGSISDESESHPSVKTLGLQLLGGSVDGIAQVIPGAPQLQTGEEGIFFLKCIKPDNCRLVGYGQGLWRPLTETPETEGIETGGIETEDRRWRQAIEGSHLVSPQDSIRASTQSATPTERGNRSLEIDPIRAGSPPSAPPEQTSPTLTLDQLLKLTIKR